MNYRVLLLAVNVAALQATGALAANSVVVESRSVAVGATGVTVGVHFQNDVELGAWVLPLEFRSLDSGAYISGVLDAAMQARFALWNNPGASFVIKEFYSTKTDSIEVWNAPAECPPDSVGLYWKRSSATVDFASPDALVYAAIGMDPSSIAPGHDGLPGSGTPSLVLTFSVTAVTGQFEIDTVCVRPGNRIDFVDTTASPLGDISFTKGMVTIGCACDCHTDPQCDSVHNTLDLVRIIDVAFRGGDPIPDPNPLCPYETTDVDCDDDTDAIDVTLMNQVVNYGADPDSTFCNPCP